MSLASLLLDQKKFQIARWYLENGTICLEVSSQQTQADCPECHSTSGRKHSRYVRTIVDVPWADYEVRIYLEVTRFFCDEEPCGKKTFTERLPSFVRPYGRRSIRLAQKQTELAFAAGGQCGSKIASLLKMPISSSTLIRLIRQTPEPTFDTPRVLGVDDWALRKGQQYGTILVDLEENKPIDLLPERSSESLAVWLKAHPEVEIVVRDRGRDYIKGATDGAPEAIQVADRWHLLKNMREGLQKWFDSRRGDLKVTRDLIVQALEEETGQAAEVETTLVEEGTQLPPLTKVAQEKAERNLARRERYDLVHELHQQGLSKRAIASQMGLCFRTVQRYLAAEECPKYASRPKRPGKLQPFLAYLEKRWHQGCHNATQLWQEIKDRGFDGSASLVRRWAVPKRQQLPQGNEISSELSKQTAPKPEYTIPWSATKASWIFVKKADELTEKERELLQRLCDHKPLIHSVYKIAQQFTIMIRDQQVGQLSDWLTAAKKSTAKRLVDFAKGLEQDLAAVKAALLYKWSTSPVEGQINRLKLIKRTMYGRAKFDLLKKRVLGHDAFT